MYLAKQNKLPSCCLQRYFAQISEIHTYDTSLAKRNSFYVTRFNKSITKRSIRFRLLELRHGTICQKILKPSSQLQYNLSKKTETITTPPRKTNLSKVCFPF